MFETSNYQLWPDQLVHSNKRGNQETRLSKVGCKSMLKYIWGSPWIHNDPEVSVGRRHLFCSMPPRPISQSLLSPSVQYSVSLTPRSPALVLSNFLVSVFITDWCSWPFFENPACFSSCFNSKVWSFFWVRLVRSSSTSYIGYCQCKLNVWVVCTQNEASQA